MLTSSPRAELASLLRSGELKHRESVSEGFDATLPAFFGMLKGLNFGKTLVKL